MEAPVDTVGARGYRLLRVLKREAALSSHAVHTQRRIEFAKALLRQGISIAEVALEAGFSDQSHFTDAFRQFVGATPGQYAGA